MTADEPPPRTRARRPWVPKTLPPLGPGEVRLLSGGNPQIAKGDGEGPVQAYIAAMPGWKRAVGARIDALVTHVCPEVEKAVRWNSPFWSVAGQGAMLNLHCVTRYVKVCFLMGSRLDPVPPVPSAHADARYLHIHEDDDLDEAQFAEWVRQATKIPSPPFF